MSRKTYSLSAVALVATASLSFSSADGAEAFAQATTDDVTVSDLVAGEEPVDLETAPFEIIPSDVQDEREIEFISKPVTQTFPVDAEVELSAPVISDAGSLSELVGMVQPGELSDQMQCLAGAVYFESRGEPLAGQLAVAQVVINRSEDARWPTSYCGVVYQRAQFSFVKNGRMPRIRTSTAAWQRAKAIAQIAHEGLWESEAGEAVYFHATYVRPKWSYRKQRTAKIDTHIFYR
ncbi:MAG: cell wall hydrolase [Pseudomonadota bacterium]